MTTKENKKQWSINKSKELSQQLDDVLIDKLISKEEIKKLTTHYKIAGVYGYSFHNSMLIYIQNGSIAQSFQNWKKLERQVKKGEHAHIWIFVPVFYPTVNEETGEEEQELMFFTMKPVFDVDQTEGKELEYIHNSDNCSLKFDDILTKLKPLINKPVIITHTKGRGYVNDNEIAISSMSNNTDKIHTLIHETAHETMKHLEDKNRTYAVHEVEAESVTNMVLSYLEIEYSLPEAYINGWKRDNTKVDKKSILKTADKIIKKIIN